MSRWPSWLGLGWLGMAWDVGIAHLGLSSEWLDAGTWLALDGLVESAPLDEPTKFDGEQTQLG
jgi:hypothetical protein